MSSEVYFDGDPATDSARRHMERVLKGEPTRKWPWIVAALGGGGLWMLFRMGGDAAKTRAPHPPEAQPKSRSTSPASASPAPPETLASRR